MGKIQKESVMQDELCTWKSVLELPDNIVALVGGGWEWEGALWE